MINQTTILLTKTSSYLRRLLQSTPTVVLGFWMVVILSLGTDQVLNELQVYQPWGQSIYDPGLNVLALAYRCVCAVV